MLKPILVLFLLFLSAFSFGWEITHHALQVKIHPEESHIDIVNTIECKKSVKDVCDFSLNSNLQISEISPGFTLDSLNALENAKSEGINSSQNTSGRVAFKKYQVKPNQPLEKKESLRFTLRYQGKIHYPITQQGAEYLRSFEETPGIISAAGVYLCGDSFWYPRGTEKMVRFRVEIVLPEGWEIISQGSKKQDSILDKTRTVVWHSPWPVDEIYLTGGPLVVYEKKGAIATSLVYLRKKDDALAQRYLEATEEYLNLYSQGIGPYPYDKFALIENFWETGYGMPSFTLLGSTVIRLPFLLESSYPHEILHNWWGNGVFVDYSSGNWCEGLTAYMADHLMKEKKGQGAEYRRQTLQRYRDFVKSSQDFPLVQFRSRHSPVTEAVGYGKSMMLFHELRKRIGDEAFLKGIQKFYREFEFKVASFSDLQKIFSLVSGQNLEKFFHERIALAGAPEVSLQDARQNKAANGILLQFTLEQKGIETPYELHVPIAISLEGQKEATIMQLPLTQKSQHVALLLKNKPIRIDVDPEFDVFRKLYRSEIPASIGQIFGAEEMHILLAASSNPVLHKEHEAVAKRWSQGRKAVVSQDALSPVSKEHSTWILADGEAPFLKKLFECKGVQFRENGISISGQFFPWEDHIFVLTASHPENDENALGWILGNNAKGMAGLARKLPHYGKYSYLVFQGQDPTNVLKGQWPILASPMSYTFYPENTQTGELPKNKPLITVENDSKAQEMMKHIRFLADPEKKGRAIGTKELDAVASYIADFFQKSGLSPFQGKDFFQTWEQEIPVYGKQKLANILGIAPGQNKTLSRSCIIVGAHYDHLGMGEVGSKPVYAGKAHPGADDNASGIAVMLDCAEYFAKNPQKRSILFVAFTAEESGYIGSRAFLHTLSPAEKSQIFAMINLDTIGRLQDQPLLVLACNSAKEWPHIFRGCSFQTGIPVLPIENNQGSSDQIPFLEEGIPAVQFFSGPHEDYHTPQDTIEKIAPKGLEKSAKILKEALLYLANREEPLTTQNQPQSTTSSPHKKKASFGIMPDFAYTEKGVRALKITPSSRAHAMGLQEGDIIIYMGQFPISNLKDLADCLKFYTKGETIKVTYIRHGKQEEGQVELETKEP
ncbi:MAG: M20/M25/M40 family metallo-hydrolase [Candidatus Brocadiae bacterium]|nr:M20/M25/M40 family metallo-hydrolase [Candidatus Brocadiia bacterium]